MPGHSLRKLRYILEAIPVYIFYGICVLLPLDAASAFGGWLASAIGPLMGVSRRAERNLSRALPQLTARERAKIIRGMWNNLGRVGAEYPHLPDLVKLDRISGEGRAIFEDMARSGKGGIIVGGHLANWEIGPLVAGCLGMPLAVIYRAPNNPYVDRLIKKAREKIACLALPKGADGAIQLMRHLRGGGYAGILIDQKLNEGIAVPFFGMDARTTPAPAEMAIRFNLPIGAARVERVGGKAYFRMEFVPYTPPATGNRSADAAELTRIMTAQLESWIRERPEQWLWLHNRWPKG
ncbi:MAG: lysophospholipid acyltransferase family protein [Alphaproteobacteria bacterium]